MSPSRCKRCDSPQPAAEDNTRVLQVLAQLRRASPAVIRQMKTMAYLVYRPRRLSTLADEGEAQSPGATRLRRPCLYHHRLHLLTSSHSHVLSKLFLICWTCRRSLISHMCRRLLVQRSNPYSRIGGWRHSKKSWVMERIPWGVMPVSRDFLFALLRQSTIFPMLEGWLSSCYRRINSNKGMISFAAGASTT